MSLLRFFANEYREYMERQYAFCPTGKGGGIDNSCSPTGESGVMSVGKGDASPQLIEKLKERHDWAQEFLDAGGKFEADGTVWLYHRTSQPNAEQIAKTGVIKAPAGTGANYGIYGSTSDPIDTYDGSGLIAFRVRPSQMHIDDVMPGRRADFRIASTAFRPLEIRLLT